tara:strand:- start:11146 stop:11391 length:246 start_codon:yes stop_codon:yes gene_type:complete
MPHHLLDYRVTTEHDGPRGLVASGWLIVEADTPDRARTMVVAWLCRMHPRGQGNWPFVTPVEEIRTGEPAELSSFAASRGG